MKKFENGDNVQCGELKLVVIDNKPNEDGEIRCEWTDAESGDIQTDWFSPESLTLIIYKNNKAA